MSLLRDALKKAERAQEEARRESGVQPLALEPAPAPAFEPMAADEPVPAPEVASLDSEQIASPEQAETSAPPSNARAEPVWEPSPKLPFYFALSALLLVAGGAGGYFWLQLRAPSSMAHSATPRPAPQAPPAQPKPAATTPLLATTEQALASLARPEANESAPETPSAAPPQPKAAAPVATPTPRTDPIIVPRPSPRSEGRLASDDPRRLKEIPGSPEPSLAFLASLGSEHARNARWSEARDAFAIAAADDPENPDVAFNLAVSFDRLQRKREALEYYQRALALRKSHPAHFPADAARERMRYLARSSAADRR